MKHLSLQGAARSAATLNATEVFAGTDDAGLAMDYTSSPKHLTTIFLPAM